MDTVFAIRDNGLVVLPLRDRNWSTYRPRSMVRAICMNEDFQVTRNLEGGEVAHFAGVAGDYIVEEGFEHFTVIPAAEFRATHEQIS